MNALLALALVGLIGLSAAPAAAQTTSPTPSSPGSPSTTTQQEVSKDKDKVDKKSPDSTIAGNTTTSPSPTWESEVFFPLVRLLGVAVILGLLLWWLDLPALMKAETWTDRTVIALIIIFGFAAATLIKVDEKPLTALKGGCPGPC